MTEFELYLRLGFEHISDLKGYDHILFVIALAAVYPLREWKHLLILVTAFTIGHSVTLALSTLGWVNVDADLIETLIPVTVRYMALSPERCATSLPDKRHRHAGVNLCPCPVSGDRRHTKRRRQGETGSIRQG